MLPSVPSYSITDSAGAGVQAELILGAIERKARSAQPSNSSYLEHRVQYLQEDAQLVDPDSQGVMMAWEGPLMQAHAKVTALAFYRRDFYQPF